MGIEPRLVAQMTGLATANYGVSGTDLIAHEAMVRQLLHRRRVPGVVILGVDELTFSRGELWQSAYLNLYPYFSDPAVRAYLKSKAATRRDYYLRQYLPLLRFTDVRNLALRGFCNRRIYHDWVVKFPSEAAGGRITVDDNIAIDQDKVARLHRILAVLKAQKVPVILLFIPSTDVFTRMHDGQYHETLRIIKEIAAQNKVAFVTNATYLSPQHDKFFDEDHLNNHGQQLLSSLIATRVREVIKEQSYDVPGR
jgi:lysophospholipase L1-like esterase